ncbi:hypothetical protein D9M72_396060 [compost metagenome]
MVMLPTSSSTATMVGAPGAVKSTVKSNTAVFALSPCAAVVTVALSSYAPSRSAVAGVKLQSPLASATTEPSTVVPSYTFTVPPGVALPCRVGVASSVTPPLAISPRMSPALSVAPAMLTVAGCTSTVKSMAAPGWPTLPATSVTALLKLCAPGASGVDGVKLQSPAALACTLPISLPSS